MAKRSGYWCTRLRLQGKTCLIYMKEERLVSNMAVVVCTHLREQDELAMVEREAKERHTCYCYNSKYTCDTNSCTILIRKSDDSHTACFVVQSTTLFHSYTTIHRILAYNNGRTALCMYDTNSVVIVIPCTIFLKLCVEHEDEKHPARCPPRFTASWEHGREGRKNVHESHFRKTCDGTWGTCSSGCP